MVEIEIEAVVLRAPFEERLHGKIKDLTAAYGELALAEGKPISEQVLLDSLMDGLDDWLDQPEQDDGPKFPDLPPRMVERIKTWARETSRDTRPPRPSPAEVEAHEDHLTLGHLHQMLVRNQQDVAALGDRIMQLMTGLVELQGRTNLAIGEILGLKPAVVSLNANLGGELEILAGVVAAMREELVLLRDLTGGVGLAVETWTCPLGVVTDELVGADIALATQGDGDAAEAKPALAEAAQARPTPPGPAKPRTPPKKP